MLCCRIPIKSQRRGVVDVLFKFRYPFHRSSAYSPGFQESLREGVYTASLLKLEQDCQLAAKAKVQLRIIFAPGSIGCSVKLTDCFAQHGCSQFVSVFVASFTDQEMAQRRCAGQMLRR